LAQSDGQGQRAGRDVLARYFRLFPHLVSQLPCWAVTSLSARGRIPLEPGFFDLLVIDEASQCDIASLLPLLFRAKAAVIIGDPMQLRHISGISPRRDRDLLQQHGLAETCINWAFSENSSFDLASPLHRLTTSSCCAIITGRTLTSLAFPTIISTEGACGLRQTIIAYSGPRLMPDGPMGSGGRNSHEAWFGCAERSRSKSRCAGT